MKQRGINLIEVMITIAILAILLAIGIPLFNNYIDGKKLDTALRQVEADLRKAQSLAKASGKSYTVDFTQNSSAYQIHNSSSVSASLENGVISKNTVSVTFNPAYSTSEITSSNTVTIVLKSPKGAERSVLVNPAGKITITP
ncbi:MAG: prepilin-type N-terminal cleavage/methylation domain-containing protein [Caldiserica bacterium]|jgi:prepilin-type N-terminal cleavage/methylation domain-containing protein|nr:prepilin-type N-terminal cleavage/methylation domain-containing protein [Caldisericota bacterium]MDH7561822.1 prepilin-type N-terminal cleavage/methylation domain-containing protein [Caldisericota bacterium]